MNLKDYIASIENYPQEGITFRDISPLMADGNAYSYAIREIVQYATDKKIDMIVGPEARGFIVGCPVAFELGIGFAPVRKPGKLPREVISADYEKEYGVDTLTMHADAIKPGQRVLIVDGETVPYCLARIPQGGETRGNLAAGGRGEPRPLTESDWEIARRVGPTLKAKGLIFVGLDIIGDRLTEVNVTSPTCIREIEAEFPISITGMLMDAIEKRLQK